VYLYTFIIGHQFCNMLSILHKLKFQKELQNFVTNNVFFWQKVKTQQQQNKKSNIKTLATAKNWTRDLLHTKRLSFHWICKSIVVKLFNCFNPISRNVNKQSAMCGAHSFTKLFCHIFTSMNNYIWQFFIYLLEYVSLL